MPFIEIQNLTVGYGLEPVISGFSFSTPQPNFIVICGNNGAGKSSLFKALTHLVPYKGSFKVNSQAISSFSSSQFIAALGQDNPLYFDVSVIDLINLAVQGSSFDTESKSLPLDSILDDFEIKHLKHRSVFELSGGEKQLVWLAHTYAQNKSLYLLDEPTQHLDIYQRNRMLNFWAKLPEKQSKGVMCITHDLPFLDTFPTNGQIFLVGLKHIEILPLDKSSLNYCLTKLSKA